ncbi:MAG: DNA polymerase III subunit gamma/tau, partial [Muribaculaceae bacterium]|nr:DNA polymerase III subunit gamma/tau [Muribaculaceae bacterium]
MDKYIVSARKYRPATFRSVVGQKSLTSTLKNAIASDRLAQAYLFCGPRGVGKTSCARIFAKTINCLNPTPDGEACCECENCKAIERGTSMNVVELDAASNNSVDDIRDITDQVQTPPQGGRYRVFIIDEVHMLSSAAFNAFLKTLEEPPKYVIFILATTEKHKVLPTILSRCQTYDFRRITIEDMVEQMQYIGTQEGIKTDPRGLEVIARKADGAMRDALSIFDQVAASSRGDITYESAIENLNVLDYDYYFRLVEAFRTGDIPGALLLYRDVRAKGFDSLFFLNGLADHVRNLMVAADTRTAELLETSKDVAERYTRQAKSLPLQWYYAAMKVLNDGDVQYRTATNKQFLVELVLIRLSQLLKPATPPFDLVDCDYPLGDITGAASMEGRLPSLPKESAHPQPTPRPVAQNQLPQNSPSSQITPSPPCPNRVRKR